LRKTLLNSAPVFASQQLALSTDELGEIGELLAARCLRRRGARVLARRILTPHGEIDLVAICEGALVCIEVKSGRTKRPLKNFGNIPSDPGHGLAQRIAASTWRPGHRFDVDALERVTRASHWLAKRLGSPEQPLDARVDLWEFLIAAGPPKALGLFHHADLKEPLPRPQ
jgi:hypothetical protein